MSIGFRIASGLALSLALVSAPLSARDYYRGGYHHYHRGGGGIGLGGALLGAAIIGGVAIAASNSNNNRQRVYEQGYDPNTGGEYRSYGGVQSYGGQGGPGYDDQQAQNGDPVEACSRAAEREAQNGGGFARVAGIDRVDNIRGGVRVRGSVDINGGDRSPSQRVPFTCSAAYGDITDLRLG
ncbi:hypothetical protein [Glacieibacterium sp.]|uniref:hypothetical protein n=1 Tax=Glacieibacterium sp. TaxID=2860237 RepID=UPI003B001D87